MDKIKQGHRKEKADVKILVFARVVLSPLLRN